MIISKEGSSPLINTLKSRTAPPDDQVHALTKIAQYIPSHAFSAAVHRIGKELVALRHDPSQFVDALEKIPLARLMVILGLYTVVLSLSWWLAFLLRFEFQLPPDQVPIMMWSLAWFLPLKLAILLSIGQFAGLLSYFSIPDLRRLFFGLLASTGILWLLWHYRHGYALPPRSVIVADFLLAFLGLAASRLVFRLGREHYKTKGQRLHSNKRRVGIIGAGDAGAALARELVTKHGLGLQPVAFFDDDRAKWQLRVHNIPVLGSPEDLVFYKARLRMDEVVIAMPSAPARRVREIVKILQSARLKFTTVPALDQLPTGKMVSQLRDVDIEDLLGRKPVKLDKKNIRHCLENRVVMVTGAGGSIGQELCRQIAEFGPHQLLLVEQSEVQLFQVEQELIQRGHGAHIQPLIADILDLPRMQEIFREYCPSVIFHAAAHKHVPMMERQPTEAIKNNTFGTARLADLASEHAVERFVLISTDKAINPTNVMGATKRLAELYIQALNNHPANSTRFAAVRFGNVLGSSGSVVPIFKQQIAAGGPVKVTHPDVTRYFMTIPEAVGLVLQCDALGKGGEIFVLDMGNPVKIVDLARSMIELSGLRPGHDIEIHYTGLRPGEKLFEEIQHNAENLAPTTHSKILRLVAQAMAFSQIRNYLTTLEHSLYDLAAKDLKLMLKQAIPEYTPYLQAPNVFPPQSLQTKRVNELLKL